MLKTNPTSLPQLRHSPNPHQRQLIQHNDQLDNMMEPGIVQAYKKALEEWREANTKHTAAEQKLAEMTKTYHGLMDTETNRKFEEAKREFNKTEQELDAKLKSFRKALHSYDQEKKRIQGNSSCGANNVFLEHDIELKNSKDQEDNNWYVKKEVAPKPIQQRSTNTAASGSISDEVVSHQPQKVRRKAFEAEDLPRKKSPDFVEPSLEVRAIESPVVPVDRVKKQNKLLNQLELISADIARAFCAQRYPVVKPAANFDYLLSKGFAQFRSVKDLEIKDHLSVADITKKFAAQGGGAILAIDYLLQNDDLHTGNIGFSNGSAVAIDTGRFFAPIFFDISYPHRINRQKRVYDLHNIDEITKRAVAMGSILEVATNITLENAYDISDEVLCELPKSSCQKVTTTSSQGTEETRIVGYRPTNGADVTFNCNQHGDNVESFLQNDPQYIKDQLLQFLIIIIVYKTGFITQLLNKYAYDELLKQQILNSLNRVLVLEKRLFDQTNQIHHRLRALITPEELQQAVHDHVQCYNKDSEPNFQLNPQACNEQTQKIIAELTKPLEHQLPAPKPSLSPQELEVSIDELKAVLTVRHGNKNFPNDKEQLRRLYNVYSLRFMFDEFLGGSREYIRIKFSELFDRNKNLNITVLLALEELYRQRLQFKKVHDEFIQKVRKFECGNLPLQKVFDKLINYVLKRFVNTPTEILSEYLKSPEKFLLFIKNNQNEFTTATSDTIDAIFNAYFNLPPACGQTDDLSQQVVLQFVLQNPSRNFDAGALKEFLDVIKAVITNIPQLTYATHKNALNILAEKIRQQNQKFADLLKLRSEKMLSVSTDSQISGLATRIFITELEANSFLSPQEFQHFCKILQEIKANNLADFSLLMQENGMEFLTKVFLNINPSTEFCWHRPILSSALHWYGQADKPLNENSENSFLFEVKKITDNHVKFRGFDALFYFTPTAENALRGNQLFELKYQHELARIEEQCRQKNTNLPPKESLTLANDLKELNQKSIALFYDNQDVAGQEALACCEKTVKLFSKKNNGVSSGEVSTKSFTATREELPKVTDYPVLQKHRGVGIIVAKIAKGIDFLITKAGNLFSGNKQPSMFASSPWQTKSGLLVQKISCSAEAFSSEEPLKTDRAAPVA